jgi:hypothetical protein
MLLTCCSEKVEKFNWGEVRRGIFSLGTWLTAFAYFGILAGLYSFGLFVRILEYPYKASIRINILLLATNHHHGTGLHSE